MREVDVRLLRDQHLLVEGADGALAVVTNWGWVAIPQPLAGVVRAALTEDTGDDC